MSDNELDSNGRESSARNGCSLHYHCGLLIIMSESLLVCCRCPFICDRYRMITDDFSRAGLEICPHGSMDEREENSDAWNLISETKIR